MDDDEADDLPLLKYESPFIKLMILPQEPRLFCLLYNGITVEYEDGEDNNEHAVGGGNCAERESVIFKEIHNFTQRSLDDRGAFLLDFNSEAIIWVGKKVLDKDRLMIYQLAFQHLAVLHQQSREFIDRLTFNIIESGFEPEVFKTAFSTWQNFEHA